MRFNQKPQKPQKPQNPLIVVHGYFLLFVNDMDEVLPFVQGIMAGMREDGNLPPAHDWPTFVAGELFVPNDADVEFPAYQDMRHQWEDYGQYEGFADMQAFVREAVNALMYHAVKYSAGMGTSVPTAWYKGS